MRAGTPVLFTASVSPLVFGGFAIPYSFAGDYSGVNPGCTATDTVCTYSPMKTGVMTVHAVVNAGALVRHASVTVRCNTGDSTLNSDSAAKLLDSLIKESKLNGPQSQRLEGAGSIDSNLVTGHDTALYSSDPSTDACHSSIPYLRPPGWAPRIIAHVHPFAPGDTIPTIGCGNLGARRAVPGPSDPDTAGYNAILRATGYTGPAPVGVIPEPNNLYVYDSTGSFRTVPRKGPNKCTYP